MKTYYDILGIEVTSSYTEIRDAYRKLVKEYHPDNFIRGESILFTEIQKAWEILKDPLTKDRYDSELAALIQDKIVKEAVDRPVELPIQITRYPSKSNSRDSDEVTFADSWSYLAKWTTAIVIFGLILNAGSLSSGFVFMLCFLIGVMIYFNLFYPIMHHLIAYLLFMVFGLIVIINIDGYFKAEYEKSFTSEYLLLHPYK